MKSQLHLMAQDAILKACLKENISAKLEYHCSGYIPDVMVFVGEKKYAFEIQVSPQSLKKTRERQGNYLRDGIIGCWLFEKEPSKIQYEMNDLPIFKLVVQDNQLFVSLKDRKTLPLDIFIRDFITGRIKFCQNIKPLPTVTVNFIEFPCWKCGTIHHIYYLDNFQTACNIKITANDHLWSNNKIVFDSRIVNAVKEYAKTEKGSHLVLPTIKERYSRTVGKSYMSFGCSKCDSIFGDFYIHEAIIDSIYEEKKESYSFEAHIELNTPLYLPHWCHPGLHDFCE